MKREDVAEITGSAFALLMIGALVYVMLACLEQRSARG